jgi:hypothetical protein
MKQTVLTIITEIDPLKIAPLKELLAKIQFDLYGNTYLPFPSLTLLHFASFVIVQNSANVPLLIFENNFDGDLSGYLDQLLSLAGNGIDQIYKCCKGYQGTPHQPQELKAFLTANVVKPNAYHIGNVGRAAKDVSNNRQLRIILETYLDKLFGTTKPEAYTSNQLRQNLQGYVNTQVSPVLSQPLPPHQTFAEKVMPQVWKILVLALAGVLAIALLPITLGLVYWLRRHERADRPYTDPASLAHVDDLMKTENLITQNHLASITAIKPGPFRLYLLKAVLFAANLLARTSNKGTLSGIPSIHFAHWSIIGNNQLLFLSNFDGSWSSYLDDFIDKASTGLTGIWSNTVGFPETRFLVLDGARDELHFKAFARGMQVPSLVWYCAYPDLTVQHIDKDSAIREEVLTNLSEEDTKKWLKLF